MGVSKRQLVQGRWPASSQFDQKAGTHVTEVTPGRMYVTLLLTTIFSASSDLFCSAETSVLPSFLLNLSQYEEVSKPQGEHWRGGNKPRLKRWGFPFFLFNHTIANRKKEVLDIPENLLFHKCFSSPSHMQTRHPTMFYLSTLQLVRNRKPVLLFCKWTGRPTGISQTLANVDQETIKVHANYCWFNETYSHWRSAAPFLLLALLYYKILRACAIKSTNFLDHSLYRHLPLS